MIDSDDPAAVEETRARNRYDRLIEKRTMSLLAAGFIGGVGFFLVAGASAQEDDAVVARRWPTTTGTVVKSEIRRSYSRHYPCVVFDYTVGGKAYTSNIITFKDNSDYAWDVLRKYPSGSKVTVHYSPESPQLSCLEPGRPGPISAFWVGLLFVVGAAFEVAKAVRAHWQAAEIRKALTFLAEGD